GMGLTQVSAGLYANHNRLQIEQCTATGLIKTYSASHLVTDSGAGATAFACGCKTYNTAIGVDKNKKPCLTLLEQAEARDMATGLVVSSSLTHATPASFYAHVGARKETEAIAADFLQHHIDFAVGGGLYDFAQRSTDSRDLRSELQARGYVVTDSAQSPLAALQPDPAHPFVWFSATREPKFAKEGRDYLPVAARMAPVFLQKRSDKGFFLMIEGSQIDWACHQNSADNAIGEMLDFDAAIGAVLDFAKADGHTLVVITADHETGGMSIVQGSQMDNLELKFNTAQHTGALVPVFAYGPGARLFNGVYENTDIYVKIAALLGFTPQ
ncbi:MAG TPA: alkaline phosphatase, partial [Saprospiraceae bacterium]|nr:alkaline phosphatase [Saprospiraceae bacterium]